MRIKNNASTNDLVAYLKCSKDQYKNLTKTEERAMIDKYRSTDEDKLRNLLVLHNMRYVFSLAKKYAQQTQDFDDLIGKGFYGLVMASKKFDFDMTVMKKKPVLDENGKHVTHKELKTRTTRSGKIITLVDRKTKKPLYVDVPDYTEEMQYEQDGVTPKYIKFNTYATWWILKYMRKEFNDEKEIVFTSKMVSLNKKISDSSDGSESSTIENFVNSMVSPDVDMRTAEDDLSSMSINSVCDKIYDYIGNSTQLSAIDKQIFFDVFRDGKKSKDVADALGANLATIASRKTKLLQKIRGMLKKKMRISSMDDILVK